MVYDEGFEIFLDSGENYFAFSKYTLKKNIQPKDDDDETTEGYYYISFIIHILFIVRMLFISIYDMQIAIYTIYYDNHD